MRWTYFIMLLAAAGLLCVKGTVDAQRAPGGDGTMRRIRVPILMYHYVSPLPADADDTRRDLTIPPDVFAAHLQYLTDEGYHTISLYQLYDALMQGTTLPPKPVILTFDDGYLDHYTSVFPALQKYGFTGTFFVITGRADAGDPAYLSWAQIDAMAQAGMSMEAHTKSHLTLDARDRDFLIYELLGSQESLQAHANVPARMLSYPVGRYDDQTLQITREVDYWLAVTTQSGNRLVSTSPLELPRIRVNGATGPTGIAYLLRGDWLDSN
ncbi:MAG: polysaccharide deacetylase family protein [Anaerolineae bacterium]|nr:polysaccharide deacetylase family protein [Anaerolineae bacterium]